MAYARSMPRVPRSSLVRFAAPPDALAAAAVERLGARPAGDGGYEVAAPPDAQPAIELTLRLTPTAGDSGGGTDGTDVVITSTGEIDIPFFAWWFRPLVRIAHRRARAHAIATLRAALAGRPNTPPPKTVVGLPPVAFSPEQATFLATASAAVAVVSFAAALFGQLSDPISDSFGASDATIGVALALTRLGALFALFAIAIADRRGRRTSILVGVVGSAVVCALSALAPNLATFTAAQVLQRGLVGTTGTVAFLAVVEEAPEGARAYAASMLALAGGFGFSFSVVTLPLADMASWTWRLPFALGGATILLAPAIARHLRETARYTALAARTDVVRGRVQDVFERHRRRFVLLAIVAFLTSVFGAPSSQFMNKYLTDIRGFSNTDIALFRTVTTAVPGLVGVLLGGRLAEARGRRPVAGIALALAAASQMIFFLSGGVVLWTMSATAIFLAGAGGIALGTLDAELFPTEVRSTSNAMLYVVGVLGSASGLLLAGGLSSRLGGIGRSVALTGIGSFLVALIIVPMLPESAARSLDDVSPTETAAEHDEYGPDP
jgi:MFS family permease